MLLRNCYSAIRRAINNITAPETRPSGRELYIALAFIWAVTCYDIYCCQWLLIQLELNPLARWIMQAGGDRGVWMLVAARVAGTAITTEAARLMYEPIMATLVFIQFICLMVLLWP